MDSKTGEMLRRDPFGMNSILYYRKDANSDASRALLYLLIAIGILLLPIPEIRVKGIEQFLTMRHAGWQVWKLIGMFLMLGECYRQARHSYIGYRLAYLGFKQRLLEFEIGQKAAPLLSPSLYYVLFKDLRAYEDELRDYIRHYRRNIESYLREKRWNEQNEELTERLDKLLNDFAVDDGERGIITERWESIRNPKRRKQYLGLLEGRLSYDRLSAKLSSVEAPQVNGGGNGRDRLNGDAKTDRLALLENHASRVESEESRKYMEAAAMAASRHEKIRLIKLALRAEQQTREAPAEEAETETPEEKQRMLSDVQFLSLQDLARERFSLTGLTPPRVNPVMAREIILALLAPGKRGRRFQAAYRAEDTLRVMVRRQYEVHLRKQFDPRIFRDTLSWLVNESVLFTKPKTDEQVFSLTSKTRGKSDDARKVINAFLSFDRSLKIM
ncbi:MAG: hypothetical protein ACM3NH_03110 [Candidatus Saccharibacteria bacterium]